MIYLVICQVEIEDKPSGNSEPSPRLAVLYKLAGSILAAVLYLAMSKQYPLEAIAGEPSLPLVFILKSSAIVYLIEKVQRGDWLDFFLNWFSS